MKLFYVNTSRLQSYFYIEHDEEQQSRGNCREIRYKQRKFTFVHSTHVHLNTLSIQQTNFNTQP